MAATPITGDWTKEGANVVHRLRETRLSANKHVKKFRANDKHSRSKHGHYGTLWMLGCVLSREDPFHDPFFSSSLLPTSKISSEHRLCRYPRLYIVSLVYGLSGGMHVGYQMSATNSLGHVLKPYFNESVAQNYGIQLSEQGLTWLWAVHVSILYFGGIFGSLFAAAIADHYGRRTTVICFSYITLISLCLNMFGFAYFLTFELLMMSRFVTGLATAINQIVAGTYITEASAVSQRCQTNILGSAFPLRAWFIVGMMLGLPQLFGSRQLWPYVYVFEMCVCCVQIVGLHFTDDSPAYLISRGRKEEAAVAIARMHSKDADVAGEMARIETELRLQTHKMSAWQMFTTTKANRRAALLAMAISGAGPLSGSYALVSYSTLLFKKMHFGNTVAVSFSIGVGCLALAGVFVCSIFLINRMRRRTLLLQTHLAVLACNYVLLICQLINDYTGSTTAGVIFAIFTALHTMSLTLGMGPFQFFLATELVPTNARAACQSIGIGFNYIASFINPLMYLPLNEAIGGFAILMSQIVLNPVLPKYKAWSWLFVLRRRSWVQPTLKFIVPLSIATGFCYYRLPETSGGRPIGEIVDELEDDSAVHSFLRPCTQMHASKRRTVIAPMTILNGTVAFEMGTQKKGDKQYL